MSVTDKRTTMLREGKINKVLITLAVPSIIGMTVNGIYNIVDTIFVGRLGTSAVGAVSVVFPFFILISAIGVAIGMGAASYISRLLGQERKDDAERTAATAMAVVTLLGLLFMIGGQVFLTPILRTFGATDTILPYSLAYARVLLLGSPVVMLKMTLNNMLRAEGSAQASMIALVLGAVLNIILDPIFIFVLNMGIVGASTATVLSQVVAVGYQLWYYLSGRSYLNLTLARLKPSKTIIAQIFKIATPLFFTQALASIAMALINTAASPYGDAAVASMGIAKRVMSLGMFVVFGYSHGFQPVAGFNYGAKDFNRLWQAIRFSLKITSAFTIGIAILFIGFAEVIVSWFSHDPEVVAIGSRTLRALSVPFPLLGFQFVYFSLFQALGKALPAGILSISRQGILLIPAVLILPRYLGLNGVILAQPTADALTLVMTLAAAWMINRRLHYEAETHQESTSEQVPAQAWEETK